jgi:hypothetical protein
MVKYTLEQRIFLSDSYVKMKSDNSVKKGFAVSILVIVFQIHQRFLVGEERSFN